MPATLDLAPAVSANTTPLRSAVRAAIRAPEAQLVQTLATVAELDAEGKARALARARRLVEHIRKERRRSGGVDALMQEYDLSTDEGVTLMCLAEALLRIPDAETTDHFIEDKLKGADWGRHLGSSESFFVNASTWGLMLAGRTMSVDEARGPALAKLVRRLGEPVIRQATRQAMRVMGKQFVMGRTIEEALERARPVEARGYRYSYDMLGEAARTAADAARYFKAYADAIDAVGRAANGRGPVEAPGVSVKLSALHPRYEFGQADRVAGELCDQVIALARRAAAAGVGFCIDAEETDRLDLSLDLIEAIASDPDLKGWDGFGLAVQAYQKRGFAVVEWLEDLARRTGRRLLVRLVKGAYWDSEIKRTQELGLVDYPVFTRKTNTDVSYLACAKRLLQGGSAFYPCFATHNAATLAAVLEMAGNRRDFEFQRLHGMGEALYETIVEGAGATGVACRIYAPVGGHEDLLAYLVRRLLENGANTSFVNRMSDDILPVEDLVRDPIEAARAIGFSGHPRVPRPADLFGKARRNSAGIDLADPLIVAGLAADLAAARRASTGLIAAPTTGPAAERIEVRAPGDRADVLGQACLAGAEAAHASLTAAVAAFPGWDSRPAAERAAILRTAADLFETERARLLDLVVREGGRTLPDAVSELREAVDFLRYYAERGEALFSAPEILPGPTGEANTLTLRGRGPFLCISPWNFPLAIFTGQIAAALMAGNPALAKPAEQTPLTAALAVELLHRAGVPKDALHLLPGDGPTIGGALLGDPRLAGVAFTGSTETARIINRRLAERDGPIATLIAETGGVNAMIVDSTALPEQVTRDVIASAFQSAGQRCSALRLVCLQEDIAEKTIAMIAGAMAELRLGPPGRLSTDVGPVIDADALAMLEAHAADLDRTARKIAQAPLAGDLPEGFWFAPRAYEIDSPNTLTKEVFGPVLHVARFPARGLDALVDAINASGYGLTLSVHSRSETRVRRIVERARVGNIYVNRNQIGAVVGVQPFGGEGLSGTGPKAGGPHYLHRFATERTLTIDTTAAGGNASLMAMEG